MKLAENCPQYVFDNAGIFSEDEKNELMQILENRNISVVTVNGKSEKKLCEQYKKRLYGNEKGSVIMVDSRAGKIFTDGELNEDSEIATDETDSYMTAVMSIIDRISV